jgi:hypothetical protein
MPQAGEYNHFAEEIIADRVGVVFLEHPSSIKNSQPYGFLLGVCPFDAMSLMGGDVEMVAWLHGVWLLLAFDAKSRGTSEQEHPFVLVLVVPKTFR